MDINITEFFFDSTPCLYSASVAEIGQNAGAITWRHSMERATRRDILRTPDEFDAARTFIRSSGGWSDEEVNAMPEKELRAMIIQWIAGDMRECGLDTSSPDWTEYEQQANEGNIPSNIYRADDGSVWFSLES